MEETWGKCTASKMFSDTKISRVQNLEFKSLVIGGRRDIQGANNQ